MASLKIRNPKSEIRNNKELLDILKDEINVKQIIFDGKIKNEVELDIKITPELKAEGQLRELARTLQDLRKEAGFSPKDKIDLWLELSGDIKNAVSKNLKDFQEKIGAKTIEFQRTEKFDAELETKIDSFNVWIGIKKI